MTKIKLYNDKYYYKIEDQIIFNVETTLQSGQLSVTVPLGFNADHIEVTTPRDNVSFEKEINSLFKDLISTSSQYNNNNESVQEAQTLVYEVNNPTGSKIVLTFKFNVWLRHYGKPRSYDIIVNDGTESKTTVYVNSGVQWRIFSDDANRYNGKILIQGADEWVRLHPFVVLGRQFEGKNRFEEYNELVRSMKIRMFRTECMKARYVLYDSIKDQFNIEEDRSDVLFKTSHDNASRTFPASTFTITRKDGRLFSPRFLGPIALDNNGNYSGIELNGIDCTHGKETMPAFELELEFSNGDIVDMQPITWANFTGTCGWCSTVPGKEKLNWGVQVHTLETIKRTRKMPALNFSDSTSREAKFFSFRTENGDYDGRSVLTFSLVNTVPQVGSDYTVVISGDISKIQEFYFKNTDAIKSVSFEGTEVQPTNGIYTNPGATTGDLRVSLKSVAPIGTDTGFRYQFYDTSYILYKNTTDAQGHIDSYDVKIVDDLGELPDSDKITLNVETHTEMSNQIVLNFTNRHYVDRSTVSGNKIKVTSTQDTLAKYLSYGIPNFKNPTLLIKKHDFWELDTTSIKLKHPTLWSVTDTEVHDVEIDGVGFWAIETKCNITNFKETREYYALEFELQTSEDIEEVLNPINEFIWTTSELNNGAVLIPTNLSFQNHYNNLGTNSHLAGVLGSVNTNSEFSINLAETLHNKLFFDKLGDIKRQMASNTESEVTITNCLKNRTDSSIEGRIEIPERVTHGNIKDVLIDKYEIKHRDGKFVFEDVIIEPGKSNDFCFTFKYVPLQPFKPMTDNLDDLQTNFILKSNVEVKSNEVKLKTKKHIRKVSVYRGSKGNTKYLVHNDTNHDECNPIFYKKTLD